MSTVHPFTAKTWDEAHLEQSIDMLGDTRAEDYARIFDRIGPFSHDVSTARAVLEVGPGLARWLQSLPTIVTRRAIEISSVNRSKLAALGVVAFPPNDCPITPGVVDLAVALSVFQHCVDSQVEELLALVAAALRPGGSFYCNGVALAPGFVFVPDCVSLHRPLDAMIRMALAVKLQVTGVLEHPIDEGGRVSTWTLRLTRAGGVG